jgi:glycosyltransferase EpsD
MSEHRFVVKTIGHRIRGTALISAVVLIRDSGNNDSFTRRKHQSHNHRDYQKRKEQKLSLRKELGVSDKDFICLCTGELNKNKNQKFLIDLVPKLKERIPNIKLWLAGNGASKEDVELQIEKLGVSDSVTLLGYQPKIENYVRASDVVLTASKREGLPFNVVEAMLTKRPVVASVNRGHRELIKDRETGFITNEKDKYFENIVSLFEDKNLYQNIAKNAYDYAQSYIISATINEFQGFINNENE